MDFGTRSTTTVDDIAGYQPDDGSISSPVRSTARESSNTVPGLSSLGGASGADTAMFPEALTPFWTELLKTDVSVGLYRDLVRLAIGGRGPAAVPLRRDSLKSFVQFWGLVHNQAVAPEIALAPDGTIHAEWYQSPTRRLDVRFAIPKVYFGLFDGSEVLEGVQRPEDLARMLVSHRSRPLSRSSR